MKECRCGETLSEDNELEVCRECGSVTRYKHYPEVRS